MSLRSNTGVRRGRLGFLLSLSLGLGMSGLAACVPTVQNGTADGGLQDPGVVAYFNPAASPAVVPTPTDLVRVNGALQIPVDPSEATVPALQAFNTYLRSLDGWTPDTTVSTTFSGALNASTLASGVYFFDFTNPNAPVQLQSSDPTKANYFSPALAAGDPTTLTITTPQPLQGGHTYVAAVLSWQNGGVQGADGRQLITDQAFTFLRSARPLVGLCADPSNAACVCPSLTSGQCQVVVDGLTTAQATQLEVARQTLAAPLATALKAAGRTLNTDVAIAWSFTISKRPFAAFDQTHGIIPFPSDLLLANPLAPLAPGATHVAVPIAATDPPAQQQLKTGLNTLDGFSTTGSAQFPINGTADIVAASVTNQTTLFVNTTTLTTQPSYSAAPLYDTSSGAKVYAGQIWLTPTRPLLGDQNRYAAVLTTAIKDSQGQALTPPPATVLLTQGNPLIVNGKSAIPSLSLAQATQLEGLRVAAIQPVVQALGAQGLKPTQIAALTLFRTQTITGANVTSTSPATAVGMLQLSSSPYSAMLPTDVTITKVISPGAALPGVGSLIYGTMTVLQLVSDLGPLSATPTPKTIPFLLTLPPKSNATPQMVIVQHGLTRWRGDALAIAPALASANMAAIAIDVIYHGARVLCLSSADCASGVACTQTSATTPGTCAGGQYLTAAGATPLPGVSDAIPDSSLPNKEFTNFANLFASRDNFRQHPADLTQLVRVLQATGGKSLQAQLASMGLPGFDGTNLAYVGQSLGSLLGTNFLAVTPFISTGVLDVGGAPILDIFANSPAFMANFNGFIQAQGLTLGSAATTSLLDTIRWILDPGDPINLARNVRVSPLTSPITMAKNKAKFVIVPESGMDTVIPNAETQRLGVELGLPLDANGHLMGISGEGGANPTNVSTFWTNADHGAIFDFVIPALTVQIQTQAVTYLKTGLGGSPTVLPAQ